MARVCIYFSHTIVYPLYALGINLQINLGSLLSQLAENHLISLIPPPLPILPSFTASPPYTHSLTISLLPLSIHFNLKLRLKFGQSSFLFLLSLSSHYVSKGGFSLC